MCMYMCILGLHLWHMQSWDIKINEVRKKENRNKKWEANNVFENSFSFVTSISADTETERQTVKR